MQNLGLIVALGTLCLLTGCFEGKSGLAGQVGPTGSQGPQGTTGQRGADGPRGELGPVGPQGPQGSKGDRGEQGLVTSNIRLVQESGDSLSCNPDEVIASVICNDGTAAIVNQKRNAKCGAPNVVGICAKP